MLLTNTFGLYTNQALTTEFSGVYQLVHQTNLSDNPQDFVLYLGSATAGRQLQTSVNSGVDDIILSVVDILPHWTAATAYIVGKRVQPIISNNLVYQCTVGGTSAASQPSWPASGFGSTVVDNNIVWQLVSPKHQTTEIKLALSSVGLNTATAGAALNITNVLLSSSANAVAIHIRVSNAVNIVANNFGNPELALSFNSITESSV